MDKSRLQAEIGKLNLSQRASVRRLVPAVREGDRVAVYKAKRGAHVYVETGGRILSLLLGPRGRQLDLKTRGA